MAQIISHTLSPLRTERNEPLLFKQTLTHHGLLPPRHRRSPLLPPLLRRHHLRPSPRLSLFKTPASLTQIRFLIPSLAGYTPETRVTTLPNGLRVVTESNIAAKDAAICIWIDTGARFETNETSGTAHFVEHMMFEGTTKRSAREIYSEMQSIGGHFFANTSMEFTRYYAKVLSMDVYKALDILADMLQNSTFDDDRINIQRSIILRELKEQQERKPVIVLSTHLHAAAFQDTPLGRTTIGPAENIKTITKDHLQNYFRTHYTAPRMVVAVAGAVKHEVIVEQVKTLFTKLSEDPTTTASQLVAKEPSIFSGSEVRILDDDIPLARFAVAFEGAARTDPDFIALMVMEAILNSCSRRFGAFNLNYKDTGLFGVSAVAKKGCLDDLCSEMMHEITKLAYWVSDADVILARHQLKSALVSRQRHMVGTLEIAQDIGSQVINYGRRIPFARMLAKIDMVDASVIKRVANRFIHDKDIAIAATGPIQGLPDYNWFRSRTYRYRD